MSARLMLSLPPALLRVAAEVSTPLMVMKGVVVPSKLADMVVFAEATVVEAVVVVTVEGVGQRMEKVVKCATGAETSLRVVLTVEGSCSQAEPVQQAKYRLDSVAPAGREATSYLSVSLAAGEKAAPEGMKL